MSVSRFVEIFCDECGETLGDTVLTRTASEARRHARGEGWRVGLPGGRDLCDECHRTSRGAQALAQVVRALEESR